MSIIFCAPQTRVLINLFYFLCFLVTVMFFVSYEECDYTHIPEEKIESNLYKATTPHMVQRTKIECKYDEILKSTRSIENWEFTKIIVYNFSATGIISGSYVPEHCNPTFSVAILVTFRNRTGQLKVFLPYMHNFLRKQNIHYKIYLIEQHDEKPWNKGLLYNIGAMHAIEVKFPCLILHDVDMLPLDERNLYVCTSQPRHMSASVDKWRYALPYDTLVGGVLAIRSDQFTAVDGFSNRFHGWGGEDDDFEARMSSHGLRVVRFPRFMSRYMMLLHRPASPNPERFRIMAENRNLTRDGLETAQYTSMALRQLQLFTWIQVVT